MKTKIVLWGTNEKEEKVLIAIELAEVENKVKITTFSEEVSTEEFYNQMMNLWREGQPVPFPEKHEVQERPLSMTEGLLPDNLKTMRSDILTRAKTEWHFVVLSAKLYSSYIDEIQEFQQRISELSAFDSGMWEEMKAFWSKVQHQVREKNLFKEHANELRSKTNALFDSLKTLKRVLDEEFEKHSKEHLASFMDKLQNIEERIEKGLGLQPIFNELKGLQRKFRDTNFTRKDRSDVWKRLDGAFKLVKEKKFGKKQGDGSALSRINRRYQGLLSAISKMETSIGRDKKEKAFQVKRIETTGGQLELQIRQAKLAMIDERISSKELKLEEMVKTQGELEKKMAIEKKKEEKRQEKIASKESPKEEIKTIVATTEAPAQQIEPQSKSEEEALKGGDEKPVDQLSESADEASPDVIKEGQVANDVEEKTPEPEEEVQSADVAQTESPEPEQEVQAADAVETESPEPEQAAIKSEDEKPVDQLSESADEASPDVIKEEVQTTNDAEEKTHEPEEEVQSSDEAEMESPEPEQEVQATDVDETESPESELEGQTALAEEEE